MANNNFDRLVSFMNKEERLDMLKKLESLEQSRISAEPIESIQEDDKEFSPDLSFRYKQESLFLKIWLFLKSIFTSTSQKILYNEIVVSRWAHALERKAPSFYNCRQNSLTGAFYNELLNLCHAAGFFKSGIAAYEDSPGEAYLFLGSLLLPELYESIQTEASPYNIPFSKEPTQEMRASLIRKMEDLLNDIPSRDRATLYSAVQSLDWLKQLVKLPFEKWLAWFSSYSESTMHCTLDSVSQEVMQFSKVICYPKSIKAECIETLYMLSFGLWDNAQQGANAEKNESKVEEFNNQAFEYVDKINFFIKTVPFKLLAAVSSGNAAWVLPNPDGVEEWFVVFKAEWRKQFDKKWDQWLIDRRKEQLRQKTEDLFKQKELPLIKSRPWVEAWGGLACNKDYTLGFLTMFFNKVYPDASSTLKTLLLEGEFVNRETRVALTDACNEMSSLSSAIDLFNAKTRLGGQIFDTFEAITSEKLRTLQNQSRMDSLMLSISSDASMMSAKYGTSIRELISLLEGVLKIKRNGKYDTISNLTTIQGQTNVAYRMLLQNTLDKFMSALDLLKELESIESSEIIAQK